jgi:hypothetical protein
MEFAAGPRRSSMNGCPATPPAKERSQCTYSIEVIARFDKISDSYHAQGKIRTTNMTHYRSFPGKFYSPKVPEHT